MSGSTVTLCLACSSSPSPKSQTDTAFLTPCCLRPICDRCLLKNPRLRGYNPCLACLAGVAVVGQSSTAKGKQRVQTIHVPGASGLSTAEEDAMFVLGSDEDEDNDGNCDTLSTHLEGQQDPPSSQDYNGTKGIIPPSTSDTSNPQLYHIQSGDTLRGIALKFGIDGAKICQMNALPLSTLSTTPHLLHTRHILTLPPGKRTPLVPPPDSKITEARNRERATKRFQFVTKEVSWDVAKTYLALAEAGFDKAETLGKEDLKFEQLQGSEISHGKGLLDGAVDQYLEDIEWEAQQGECRIPRFPLLRRKAYSVKEDISENGYTIHDKR